MKDESKYRLHIRFNQFDYDYYSALVRSEVVEVPCNASGSFFVLGGEWHYKFVSSAYHRTLLGTKYQLELVLLAGVVEQCQISVEMVFEDWHEENYFLMPSAVYNGNRFESRKIAYSPKLLDPRDIGKDRAPIISDVPRLNKHQGPSILSDRSGAMSTPSMGFYNPKHNYGFWLLSEQGNSLGDYGYHVQENRNRTKLILSLQTPVVRSLYQYRITDNNYPSGDRAPNWHVGDRVLIHFHAYHFSCCSIDDFFACWNRIRFDLIPKPVPLVSVPFSSTFNIQQEKFNRKNWVEQLGYYSVGMREMFLQDWQTGWTGGMISTYPLFFSGSEQTRQRVLRNFDFFFRGGISPSGFFYDCGELKGNSFKWYGGDIRKSHTARWHLIRKSGDALYYIIKQFWLFESLGYPVEAIWKQETEKVASAFVDLWTREGQLGQFIDSDTGEIVVGGSTCGGIAPAAMAYCAKYFNNAHFLDVACQIGAYYYNHFVLSGLTYGGVGDALQNPDSESAYGLLESFSVLYEQTGDRVWLERAQTMAGQFFTWIIGYNYQFPENCTLGNLKIQTFGAVFANTQNKHGAPGICTFSGMALWRLYRATGNLEYLEMLQAIVRFIPQMLSHPNQPIPGMPIGWMTERVSTTDWFEGIGELMCGSTWAETSLMLTYAEIPAVYVVADKGIVFAFDSVDASFYKTEEGKCFLCISNPSEHSVELKVFIEDSACLQKPLGENALLKAHHVLLDGRGNCSLRIC